MTTALDGHIEVDDAGVARIAGTRIKVIHLVMEKRANQATPEELAQHFPSLSLGQVYAALSFFYDHQAELEAQIQQSLDAEDKTDRNGTEPPLLARLRAEGKLP
jgi:uncharacterized protein (DUF433 family)